MTDNIKLLYIDLFCGAVGKDAFIVKWNSVNGKTGKYVAPSIDEPCPTVATQNRLGAAKVKEAEEADKFKKSVE